MMGKHALLLLLLLLLAAGAASCSSSDEEVLTYGVGPGALRMGELCIPYEETFPEYSGSRGEIYVSHTDRQCASGFCIAYEFHGRVTCPDGNAGPAECFTPAGDLVTASVPPNPLRTRPEDHVYCSCPCGGPPQLAPFCECPRGMKCKLLSAHDYTTVDPIDLRADSFCVKQ